MLNSEKLILVELHKTGSSRVRKFLSEVVGGETSGKLDVFSDELASQGKPVVGLVCDPLTWYLDQWKAGCAGKGDIRKRLTDDKRWDLLRSRQTNRPEKVKSGAKADPKAIPAHWGAEHAKSHWYGDANNAEAFREWLKAVVATRGIRNLIDRGYQVSPVSNLGGLMTYHYFIKFVRNGENMERSVDTMEALKALNASQAITTHFVRAESAGEDLLRILDALGIALTDEQRAAAQAFKRRGAETKGIRTFYDAESLALVAERESFVSELFGYGAAATAAAKAGKKKAGKKAEGTAADAPKLSKEEREKKREAKSARKAAKPAGNADPAQAAAKAERKAGKKGAKPAPVEPTATAASGAATSAASDKPAKVKRVKNRPADAEVIDNE